MFQTHCIGATILERARIEPAIGMQGQPLLGSGRAAALIQYDHQKENPNIGTARGSIRSEPIGGASP